MTQPRAGSQDDSGSGRSFTHAVTGQDAGKFAIRAQPGQIAVETIAYALATKSKTVVRGREQVMLDEALVHLMTQILTTAGRVMQIIIKDAALHDDGIDTAAQQLPDLQ